jgi:nucleoside-diphosphate-sugar epimerase
MLTDTFFLGRKVLVTGASGFIGKPLTATLVRLGAQVNVVSRNVQKQTGGNVNWWKGNLEDLASTREMIRRAKPDLIYHMAAHAWRSQDLSDVPLTFYGCLATTVNVLTAAAESGCRRVVLPGSLEEPVDPGDIPNSPYSAAKWASNVYGNMFQKLFGMEVIIARIFMVYGPGQDSRKVIPYIVITLLKGKTPHLKSPERIVDWIYIDDVVQGMLTASSGKYTGGQPVEIGSGIGISIGDVAKKICKMINNNISAHFDDKPGLIDEVVRIADVETAFRRTGWRPQTAMDAGLCRTIEWYKGQFLGASGDGSRSTSGSYNG